LEQAKRLGPAGRPTEIDQPPNPEASQGSEEAKRNVYYDVSCGLEAPPGEGDDDPDFHRDSQDQVGALSCTHTWFRLADPMTVSPWLELGVKVASRNA
jgi:hypothetical protein